MSVKKEGENQVTKDKQNKIKEPNKGFSLDRVRQHEFCQNDWVWDRAKKKNKLSKLVW